MFSIQFGTATKKKNSTKLESVGDTFQCLMLDNTSVVQPVFKIRWENPSVLFRYNYCYVAELHRYYFINDMVSETSTIFLLYCECDVLATFREDILNTRAFVQYSGREFNGAIGDARLPKTCLSENAFWTTQIPEFTNEGRFALTVASPASGTQGMCSTVLLTPSSMASLSERFLDPSTLESLIDYFANPMDAIISCTWTPYNGSSPSGNQTIKIGPVTLGTGAVAPRVIAGEIEVPIQLRYSSEKPDGTLTYADYRNVEPYAEHSIYLPGAGLTMIPMVGMIGKGESATLNMRVKYAFSPCTGAITYKLYGPTSLAPVMVVTGNTGVQVPVAQKNSGFAPAFANASASIGIAAASVYFNMPQGLQQMLTAQATGVAASGVVESGVMTTQTAGSLGGWSTDAIDTISVTLCSRYYEISDLPSNIPQLIGRPLYKAKRIGDLSSYCQCVGAHVETWATKEETDRISMFLNNYGTQPYGGFFIE